MSKKTYIVTSDKVSDEMFNEQQNAILEENFDGYVFIVAESGGATFSTEEGSAMLVQEYK